MRLVSASIGERLPPRWKLVDTTSKRARSAQPELQLSLEAPDGDTARLIVEFKKTLDRRDVGRVVDQVRGVATGAADVPVVAARYLSGSVREALAERGFSYVDATGNIRIAIDTPAVFISATGEDRDPWRRGRPPGSLKGEPAARVTRALLDYRRSWTVRELMAVAGSSSGATYRVVDLLEREDLVSKGEDRRYRVLDWERLLRMWSADAPFQVTAQTRTFIEPRGVDTFLRTLAEKSDIPHAVTGSVAAREWASYAPAKAVFVYVPSIEEAAETWKLRPNSAAPNVILLEPTTVGDVPFVNTVRSDAGYAVAAPAQVAADLLNGPGRDPSEGEYLLEWMKANEERWRRD